MREFRGLPCENEKKLSKMTQSRSTMVTYTWKLTRVVGYELPCGYTDKCFACPEASLSLAESSQHRSMTHVATSCINTGAELSWKHRTAILTKLWHGLDTMVVLSTLCRRDDYVFHSGECCVILKLESSRGKAHMQIPDSSLWTISYTVSPFVHKN